MTMTATKGKPPMSSKLARERAEARISTPELINRMEHNAAVLLRFYGPTEARRQMENILAQIELLADGHSGFPEAVLAMGAKLDELIENP